jgi:hypothetical protein
MSETITSVTCRSGLLRRFAPRNDDGQFVTASGAEQSKGPREIVSMATILPA